VTTYSHLCLTAILLQRPFASVANATSEHSVSQREHRKHHGTLALRNARQLLLTDRARHLCNIPWRGYSLPLKDSPRSYVFQWRNSPWLNHEYVFARRSQCTKNTLLDTAQHASIPLVQLVCSKTFFVYRLCAGYQKFISSLALASPSLETFGIFWSAESATQTYTVIRVCHRQSGDPSYITGVTVYFSYYKNEVLNVWPGAAHAPIGSNWTHGCIPRNNRSLSIVIQLGRNLGKYRPKNLFSGEHGHAT